VVGLDQRAGSPSPSLAATDRHKWVALFIVANSAAILTDAFPANQRGLALGINNVAGISGSFIGLVLGGILAPIN
jgi:hypothetical protein